MVPTPAPVESPKEMLFEFENVIADSAFEVPPPAETFSAYEPVIVPTPAPVESPKVTLLEFENVTPESAFDVPAPAETFSA